MTKDFLTVNPYSRPGTKLTKVKAIVIHWTANPKLDEKGNKNYFESLKLGTTKTYGSSHYIIGQSGNVIQCIPENEVAYHCGSSCNDPVSQKPYTDFARKKVGVDMKPSPNFYTIGIELCPLDIIGKFDDKTISSAVDLCAEICKRYGLTESDIITHNMIVGWKDCPRWWVTHPYLIEEFRLLVKEKLK